MCSPRTRKPFPVSISVDLDRRSVGQWLPMSIALIDVEDEDDRQGGFPVRAEHLGVRTHSLSSLDFENWV